MAAAELHIGVDTGTTHLAAAAGTPVVALYSHRAPIVQWAPMGAATASSTTRSRAPDASRSCAPSRGTPA